MQQLYFFSSKSKKPIMSCFVFKNIKYLSYYLYFLYENYEQYIYFLKSELLLDYMEKNSLKMKTTYYLENNITSKEK